MGWILSLETATTVCSVALHREGRLEGIFELHKENVHAQKLMFLLDALMVQTGISVTDLDAIAVSKGPGSFTGLRIGASTAKGLAFALGIPLIAVDTLDALAHGIGEYIGINDFIIPMLDARRMEVYCRVLDGKLNPVSPLSAEIIHRESFMEYWKDSRVFFVGEANEKVKSLLDHSNCYFIGQSNSAKFIGEIAEKKWIKREFEDLAYFEPNYLKEFRVLKSKKNLLLS